MSKVEANRQRIQQNLPLLNLNHIVGKSLTIIEREDSTLYEEQFCRSFHLRFDSDPSDHLDAETPVWFTGEDFNEDVELEPFFLSRNSILIQTKFGYVVADSAPTLSQMED